MMSLWAPRGQRPHLTQSSVLQMLACLANGFLWPLVWLLDLVARLQTGSGHSLLSLLTW